MRLWVLGSGSRGNAILLECGESRVLVDAGFTPRVLAGRLAKAGIAPESISACLVTHEHADHVRGAAAAADRWGWALLASEGTARAYPELAAADVRTFEAGATVEVGGFDLRTVPVSHDAEEPVAVVATARASGARAGICYDLGVVTDVVRGAFAEVDLLVLEANHDTGMLWAGPYPPSVAGRISGRHGHLSNRDAAGLAAECASPRLAQVVLAHLSESCNDPGLAVREVRAALDAAGYGGGVMPASQSGVIGPFAPSPGPYLPRPRRAAAPAPTSTSTQLQLGL